MVLYSFFSAGRAGAVQGPDDDLPGISTGEYYTAEKLRIPKILNKMRFKKKQRW
jgi:hypothetical protein